MPELVLGPVLRYVGIDAATVWVETDAPCQVEVLGHRERTFTVEGHHYALVCIGDLAPGQDIPYDVGLDGRRVWPPPDHPSPQPALRVIYSGAGPMRRTGPVAAVLLLVVVGVSAFFALRPSDPSPRMSSDRASSDGEEGFRAQRRDMVESQIAARGVKDRRVLAAMTAAPRHEFVPRAHLERAYSDGPLPIGFGQTISQPYIVALMTELAQVRKGDSVLEIGTGSGYQAAVLAELTDRVYSVEIVPELARDAAERLRRLGYASARVRAGDGYFGWERHAPFDAILVTAAPDHVPPPLIRQLNEGGRMVIPVGLPGSYQTLWRIRKTGGRVVSENVTDVAFVPLTRDAR